MGSLLWTAVLLPCNRTHQQSFCHFNNFNILWELQATVAYTPCQSKIPWCWNIYLPSRGWQPGGRSPSAPSLRSTQRPSEQLPFSCSDSQKIQGGSNMTGTDLYVNKPHCAEAVRPWESEATTSTLPPARVRTCSVLSGSC